MSDHSELRGRRILVTGHTGFTGSWASIWLKEIGADIFGLSLPPETSPNLFSEANLADSVKGKLGDINDYETVLGVFDEFQPELVLHLAAQPLVRRSYRTPRETFETNILGTTNILEASRKTGSVKGVLCITTDKVYKNNESGQRFVETDELGGQDPYSASKAAAELVISSYKDSFEACGEGPHIAIARGGNIIGGGDWSEDRLIPDAIRAAFAGNPLQIRNPESTRPWQHVLSLVEGYFYILSGLISAKPERFSEAFNLGPKKNETLTVRDVLSVLQSKFPNLEITTSPGSVHEAGLLALDSSKALDVLGWQPRWNSSLAIQKTADWYLEYQQNRQSAYEICLRQINSWKSA